jgi:aspartate carbamoyltransferase catalytic subunit
MRHLLSIDDLGRDGIEEILDIAESMAEVDRRAMRRVPALRGKAVATMFFEDSTRTRLSFETAAKRLSADVLSFSAASSSLKKGESIRDTALTVSSMGMNALIVRHAHAGVPAQVARFVEGCSVINAGDGWHEHPTQALVDVFSVAQARSSRDFSSLRIVVVGDIRHSRVARSVIRCYSALGASVALCAPESLLPPSLEGWPVEVVPDFDEAIADADIVSLLRLQAERGSGAFVPSLREYRAGWGMTTTRAKRVKKDGLITHPGPMVRGVEIDSEVADLANCLVLNQVRNGVAVRMAVLFALLGEGSINE